MLKPLQRWVLRWLARLFSDTTAEKLGRWLSRSLVAQLRTAATDNFLEALLRAMDIAFCLSPSFRRAHLQNFTAQYVFATADGQVGATARFAGGDMKVGRTAARDYTARVEFTDAAALRRYLFAQDQDILDSVLANDIRLAGNLNYIYKFGFMVRDLERRLGLGPCRSQGMT